MKEKKLLWGTMFVAAALGIFASVRPVWAVSDACAEDKQKFCSDVNKSDHKAMWQCMKKNHDQLSADCQTQLKKHHKKGSGSPTSTTGQTGTIPSAGGSSTNSGSPQ